MDYKIKARLINWGHWTNYDAHIGPKPPCCVSIESKHIPELGDVWDDPEPPEIVPNVADAESINGLIQQMEYLERLCLSLRYGGLPAVFRQRRISERVQNQIADNAELMLVEWLKKSA